MKIEVELDDLIATVAEVLGDEQGQCLERHRVTGREVARRIVAAAAQGPAQEPPRVEAGTSASPTGSEAHRGAQADAEPSDEISLGVWVDDPPRLVLAGTYLDQLVDEMPVSELAIMVDGPEPGLDDAKWDWRDLERLRRRVPDHVEIVLTAWLAANARAADEIASRMPALLDAAGARTFEGDVEPVGEWRERDVEGYADLDHDKRRLDDAAAAIAAVLVALPVDAVEVTTFPGALPAVVVLLEELVHVAGPELAIRLWQQEYAVATRNGKAIEWGGPLGPERYSARSRERARKLCPPRVELCSGQAAYRTRFAGGRDGMLPAIHHARAAGYRRFREWSSKWLTRKSGAVARRRSLETLRPLTSLR